MRDHRRTRGGPCFARGGRTPGVIGAGRVARCRAARLAGRRHLRFVSTSEPPSPRGEIRGAWHARPAGVRSQTVAERTFPTAATAWRVRDPSMRRLRRLRALGCGPLAAQFAGLSAPWLSHA
ncbi:hypothetical protein DVA67_003800 [Solirubrobacter sp. CPCC 204708]|nr:hypothetical protein [Solirubrobacter deserti]